MFDFWPHFSSRLPSADNYQGICFRRVVHYQSTGSLHSDSPSSSSVSPVPTSPSPSPTRPTAKTPPTPTSTHASSLSLSKRWSSTGDFNSVHSPTHNNRCVQPASSSKTPFLSLSFIFFDCLMFFQSVYINVLKNLVAWHCCGIVLLKVKYLVILLFFIYYCTGMVFDLFSCLE